MFSYVPPHMVELKQGDKLEPTYSSSVRIRDLARKTCQKRWTIRRSGERGLRISVLVTRHDDDIYAHILKWIGSKRDLYFLDYLFCSYMFLAPCCLQGALFWPCRYWFIQWRRRDSPNGVAGHFQFCDWFSTGVGSLQKYKSLCDLSHLRYLFFISLD